MGFDNVNVNVSGPAQPTSTYKTKVLKGNHSFASQVIEPNTKYVIKHDFVLDGDVTVPANCVLEFDGGSISGAYTLTGQNTLLEFSNPFLSNCILNGIFYTECEVKDTEIFKDFTTISNQDVKNLLCIFGPSNKIVISKHTFTNFESILISRNVDIDFSESIINCKVESPSNLQSDVFVTSVGTRDSEFEIEEIKIRNASIIGKTGYLYNPATNSYSNTGTGGFRHAIKLFNVKTIELVNIKLSNYDTGEIEGYHHDGTEFDFYNSFPVACMYYKNLVIDNCEFHDSARYMSMIKAVPVVGENFGIITRCKSYHSGAGFFDILDGKFEIAFNYCSEFDGSAMNAFCYDSIIHDNRFVNSLRSGAVDLSEFGMYTAKNVSVYNNYFENVPWCLATTGANIHFYNNKAVNCREFIEYSVYYNDGTTINHDSEISLNYNHTNENLSLYVNNNTGDGVIQIVRPFGNTEKTDLFERLDLYEFINIEDNTVYTEEKNGGNVAERTTIGLCYSKKANVSNNLITINSLPQSDTILSSVIGIFTNKGNINIVTTGYISVMKNIYKNQDINDDDRFVLLVGPTNTVSCEVVYNQAFRKIVNSHDFNGYYNYNVSSGIYAKNTGLVSYISGITKYAAVGDRYYATDLHKPLSWNGDVWVESDGVKEETRRLGTFAQRPTPGNDLIYEGFKYFCTDRRAPEGDSNGIEIIYKGNNTWVDTLGRTMRPDYPAWFKGPYVDKPTGLTRNDAGWKYFDTTNNRIIYWGDDLNWHDAMGNILT